MMRERRRVYTENGTGFLDGTAMGALLCCIGLNPEFKPYSCLRRPFPSTESYEQNNQRTSRDSPLE